MLQRKVNGEGGQIDVKEATAELPEWLQNAIYRGAARGGLKEIDPLWGLLVANGELMRAYLDAESAGTKKSVEQLSQEVRELARAVKQRVEPETRPENLAKRWGIMLIISFAIGVFGYFVCWSRLHIELEARMIEERQLADEQVARVIHMKPDAPHVYLDFIAHGGILVREAIKPAPGHLEQEGFAMQRLQSSELAQPWIDTTGEAAVMPIAASR